MFEVEHDHDAFLVCRLSGKLTKSDYHAMIPELENAMQLRTRPVRLLIVLEDFRGWEFDALWEDLKFGMKHRNDFDRIAVVGHSKAQKWGTWLSRPLIGGKVRFYDIGRRSAAEAWLSEGAAATQTADVGQGGKAD